MKLFGYIDDFVAMWFNWQISLPLKYCIPLSIMEILLFAFIISTFARARRDAW